MVLLQLPVQYPGSNAEMSLGGEYEDFVFGATNVDWPEIIEAPSGGRKVRLLAEGTDLRFSIADRPGINCDGHYNMPDGEVFFSPPVED